MRMAPRPRPQTPALWGRVPSGTAPVGGLYQRKAFRHVEYWQLIYSSGAEEKED